MWSLCVSRDFVALFVGAQGPAATQALSAPGALRGAQACALRCGGVADGMGKSPEGLEGWGRDTAWAGRGLEASPTHSLPQGRASQCLPAFPPAWVLWNISGGTKAPHLGKGCWDGGEVCGDKGLESPSTPGMGGWQQQPSTAGIQAAISIATGIPSQGIDLLKAQCRSSRRLPGGGLGLWGPCLPVTHQPPSFHSLCLGDRRESQAPSGAESAASVGPSGSERVRRWPNVGTGADLGLSSMTLTGLGPHFLS